jgi:hypothetical protein
MSVTAAGVIGKGGRSSGGTLKAEDTMGLLLGWSNGEGQFGCRIRASGGAFGRSCDISPPKGIAVVSVG